MPARPIRRLGRLGLQGGQHLRHIALQGGVTGEDSLLRAVVTIPASRTQSDATTDQEKREYFRDSPETHPVSLLARMPVIQAAVHCETQDNRWL